MDRKFDKHSMEMAKHLGYAMVEEIKEYK